MGLGGFSFGDRILPLDWADFGPFRPFFFFFFSWEGLIFTGFSTGWTCSVVTCFDELSSTRASMSWFGTEHIISKRYDVSFLFFGGDFLLLAFGATGVSSSAVKNEADRSTVFGVLALKGATKEGLEDRSRLGDSFLPDSEESPFVSGISKVGLADLPNFKSDGIECDLGVLQSQHESEGSFDLTNLSSSSRLLFFYSRLSTFAISS